MTGRILLRLLPIAAVLALAGCGGGGKTAATTSSTTTTTTTPTEMTSLRVYFLKDGRVQPVAREVPKTQAEASKALEQLYLGLLKQEQLELDLQTEVPKANYPIPTLSDGVISLRLPNYPHSRRALAQVVYTLTQFPTVKAVEIDGKRYTRADFEDETPIILVESPLPFRHVRSPLRATGTANTFEATFNYDLTDPDGKVIATHFVTATSGSGQRGTFDFTVPFTVDRSGLGKLIVYERSAKDGSRIHIDEIPVYLEK